MNAITSLEQFIDIANSQPAALFYFSHQRCSVCESLRPKIETEFKSQFSKIEQFYCDIQKYPELSAQNEIFVAPTILIYFEGQTFIRLSRHISIQELTEKVNRPYQLLFD